MVKSKLKQTQNKNRKKTKPKVFKSSKTAFSVFGSIWAQTKPKTNPNFYTVYLGMYDKTPICRTFRSFRSIWWQASSTNYISSDKLEAREKIKAGQQNK